MNNEIIHFKGYKKKWFSIEDFIGVILQNSQSISTEQPHESALNPSRRSIPFIRWALKPFSYWFRLFLNPKRCLLYEIRSFSFNPCASLWIWVFFLSILVQFFGLDSMQNFRRFYLFFIMLLIVQKIQLFLPMRLLDDIKWCIESNWILFFIHLVFFSPCDYVV